MNKQRAYPKPPPWADRFLEWYCNPELLEEIQGDLHEVFEREALANPAKARAGYLWNVLRFFRWSNIKRSKSTYKSNQMGLIQNYFKAGFRNLAKNWGVSLINVSGLSVAVGMGITSFIFVDMQLHMDSFHTRAGDIYQVTSHVKSENGTSWWGNAPLPVSPELAGQHSGIKNIVRVKFEPANLRYGDNVFGEQVSFVDPALLEVFDFPLKYGNKNALSAKNQMVIGKNTAEKYFGQDNPIGKDIILKHVNGIVRNYTVGAVLEKRPDNASFYFEIMIPFDNFADLGLESLHDWSAVADAVFIEMVNDRAPAELVATLDSWKRLQNQSASRWPVEHFELVPLTRLAQEGYKIDKAVSSIGNPAGVIGLAVGASLLVLLACFNYMNIAVISATRRLKEIAMRKVIGSRRYQIVIQFLLENTVMCLFSLALGTMLSYYFFMPGLNAMLPFTIPFQFSSMPVLVMFFAILLAVTGLISGAYPAFYVSRFQPVSIFKGTEKLGSKNIFSRVLLGFQFFFAFTTIIQCFVFTDNAIYQADVDWGYNPAGIISVPLSKASDYQALRDAAAGHPYTVSFAGANDHIVRANRFGIADLPDRQIKTYVFEGGPGYIETMNLRLTEGRAFAENKSEDQARSVVVNQEFLQKAGWDEQSVAPIGQLLTYDNVRYRVVGVVENFRCDDFYHETLPAILMLADGEDFSYFVVKTKPGKEREVEESLAAAWKESAPNDPFYPKLQADVFDSFYTENEGYIIVNLAISVLAILLASLGLFGLLGYSIQTKQKEFGLRKVLGARPFHIIKVASKQYWGSLIVAFVLGAPIGVLMITNSLQALYPEPRAVSAVPVLLAVVIVVFTACFAVLSQVRKAIRVNPAETLRSE